MPIATVNGLRIGHDIIGEVRPGGRSWSITPGGRFPRTDPGIREQAEALAERGHRVVIWDRPNCGESDVCFTGRSESEMQADTLAALLRHLDFGPTVIMGGSGGARISLITAIRHRDIAAGVAMLNMSGGVFGLLTLGMVYCRESLHAVWNEGMEAVAALPEWQEVISKNPHNRQRFLDQDPTEFRATMERWMHAYCACDGSLVPGVTNDEIRGLDTPSLVFRSGVSDMFHTRLTSETLASLLPKSRLAEPPWGDREWIERSEARVSRGEGLFSRWPLMVPQLDEWAREALN